MDRIKELLRAFIVEEDGAAVAEYGLLLAIVAVGMIGVLTAFRNDIGNWWNKMKLELTNTPAPLP